jgi:Cation transporting ATPase, C-terminus
VALGAEPAAEAVMRRPPRPPAESVLGAGLWKRILRIAVLITAVTLVVALWGLISGREWQTMAFLTLGTMQLTVAVALRARPRDLGESISFACCRLSLAAAAGGGVRATAGRTPRNPTAPAARPRRRHRGISIGLRRYPAGPKAAPAIDQASRNPLRTFGTGSEGQSPLVSRLALDKLRSGAISGQERTKSPTSGERDF